MLIKDTLENTEKSKREKQIITTQMKPLISQYISFSLHHVVNIIVLCFFGFCFFLNIVGNTFNYVVFVYKNLFWWSHNILLSESSKVIHFSVVELWDDQLFSVLSYTLRSFLLQNLSVFSKVPKLNSQVRSYKHF